MSLYFDLDLRFSFGFSSSEELWQTYQIPTFQLVSSDLLCSVTFPQLTTARPFVAAYEEVRSNKTETNWLLIDYEVPLYYIITT